MSNDILCLCLSVSSMGTSCDTLVQTLSLCQGRLNTAARWWLRPPMAKFYFIFFWGGVFWGIFLENYVLVFGFSPVCIFLPLGLEIREAPHPAHFFSNPSLSSSSGTKSVLNGTRWPSLLWRSTQCLHETREMERQDGWESKFWEINVSWVDAREQSECLERRGKSEAR